MAGGSNKHLMFCVAAVLLDVPVDNLVSLLVFFFFFFFWGGGGGGGFFWLSFVMSNCDVVTFPLVSWVMCGA